MEILVTYGSKRGGTAGLAESIASGLEEAGHRVTLRPAESLYGLENWDAVVVGGALYAGFWERHARSFIKRHRPQLVRMPVWFFSSGPLDDSANIGDIPAPPSVAKWMDKLKVRGHKTFGGRMDKNRADLPQGDWRDFEQARAWGYRVGDAAARLPELHRALPEMPTTTQRVMRKVYVGLSFFTGITALLGALAMLLRPAGSGWIGPAEIILGETPFSSFLIPGALLLIGVCIPNLAAGILSVQRHPRAKSVGVVAGGALTIWIVAQMISMQTATGLQVFYLVVGSLTLLTAFWSWLTSQTRLRRALEATA